ncbi:hypothetical protein Tco_0150446 [Tanacetum coccineum]
MVFSELHQLDTFYNALNSNDQDSLNSAAGGNFLDKMPRECLKIIESKSKVRQSRNKAVVAKMSKPALSTQKSVWKSLSLLNVDPGLAWTLEPCRSFNHCNRRIAEGLSFVNVENSNFPLTSEPPPPLPNHEQYMPGGRKELKLCEAKAVESSVNEPPEVELKELPPHLEYAFLEGDDKLPVIIAKDLKDEEKAALLKVLKSHKRAIAWKLSDIKGVSPEFCTQQILIEEDYEPSCAKKSRGR